MYTYLYIIYAYVYTFIQISSHHHPRHCSLTTDPVVLLPTSFKIMHRYLYVCIYRSSGVRAWPQFLDTSAKRQISLYNHVHSSMYICINVFICKYKRTIPGSAASRSSGVSANFFQKVPEKRKSAAILPEKQPLLPPAGRAGRQPRAGLKSNKVRLYVLIIVCICVFINMYIYKYL